MEEYIGFDVSMKETAISIRRNGKRHRPDPVVHHAHPGTTRYVCVSAIGQMIRKEITHS
jgi:hypothetical protein